MNKNRIKKTMSAFFAFVFAFSIMSAGVFAAEGAVSAKDAAIEQLMDNIAEDFVSNSNEWVILDMAAYGNLKPDSEQKTDEQALQSYINYAIGMVSDNTKIQGSAFSAYAKAEIILTAIGGDTDRLYPLNSNNPIKISDKVKEAYISQATFYDAPWILLANLQGNWNLSKEDINKLIDIIGAEQPESSVFGYTWDGEFYTDPDTTATIITALSSHYNTNQTAKGIVDKALAGLSIEQGELGSFGNSNSDSMVIIALASMNIDPMADTRFVKRGISLYDALLAFSDNGSGTAGAVFGNFKEANSLETEQGFRALIAVNQMKNTGRAFNIYDFSNISGQALRATGTGEVNAPSAPTGEGNIAITFSLKADGEYWIDNSELTIQQGSSVYHAFVEALSGGGFNYKGAENGYVRSITNLGNGIMFSEFDQGIDSGWLFKVNGEVPEKGFLDYELKDGDEVVWFFTDDYVRDSGHAETAEEAAEFSDVPKTHFDYEAIMQARDMRIISGTGNNTFEPDRNITRAEFAAMLYNLDDRADASSTHVFKDVAENDWFYKQVSWAFENELIPDVSDVEFVPMGNISRQDVFVIIYKYLTVEGCSHDEAEKTMKIIDENFEESRLNLSVKISRAKAARIIIHMMDTLEK